MARPAQHIVEKKTDLIDTIVDAAERLLNSYGYQKMTMTDLAAEAGIGVGTTYLHFASKADVAVAVIKRIHDRIYANLEDIAQDDGPAELRLERMLWHHVQFPYDFVREKLTRVSWQQLNRHGTEFMDDVRSTNPTAMNEWKRAECALIAHVIEEGIDSGDFIPVGSYETAATMLEVLCGYMPKNLEQTDFNNAGEFEQRTKRVITLLINGILVHRRTNTTTETTID